MLKGVLVSRNRSLCSSELIQIFIFLFIIQLLTDILHQGPLCLHVFTGVTLQTLNSLQLITQRLVFGDPCLELCYLFVVSIFMVLESIFAIFLDYFLNLHQHILEMSRLNILLIYDSHFFKSEFRDMLLQLADNILALVFDDLFRDDLLACIHLATPGQVPILDQA